MSKLEPRIAWAVFINNGLAVVDRRLPLFWMRKCAKEFNAKYLEGTGRIQKVEVYACGPEKAGRDDR